MHRDLKTGNLILTKNDTVVKVAFLSLSLVLSLVLNDSNRERQAADLGVSRQVSEETEMLRTFYGTPLYLSPELVV